MGKLRTFTLTYNDGTTLTTNAAQDLTDQEITEYYLNQYFQYGGYDFGIPEYHLKVIHIQFLPDTTTCPHCGHAQPNDTNSHCDLTQACGKPLH